METGCCGAGPVRVSEALRVLSDTVRGSAAAPAVWFKESSQRNLKSRDFLVPRGALRKSFPGEEIPGDLIHKLTSLNAPGVPPIQNCLYNEAGLVIQLDRPAVFQRVLADVSPYLKPVPSGNGQCPVIVNCAPLQACESLNSLKLSHLRAAFVADHLAEMLRLKGVQVQLIPTVLCKEVREFLQQLGVSWSSIAEAPFIQETVTAYKKHLQESVHITPRDADQHPLQDESRVLFNVHLKPFAEQQHLCLEGYDPNLDVFLVNEEDLKHLAEVQKAAQEHLAGTAHCTVLHVVSCDEELHQQKLDLLWRMLDPGAQAASQKHLICGPVKVLSSSSPVSCSQYFHLRKTQMHEASVMKYGDLVQGESWDEIINSLTAAAIKFEMMATAHRSKVTLDLEDSNITTKGTKSGAFVMYNCARLATLFEGYSCAVRQGLYPEFPSAGELNYAALREEGEWLLLFNYIMPFPEVLSQSAQVSLTSPGIRVTANTEAVCKFLVNLSMDFSSYYNRVHILGEPLPHLFAQMFARLQLMKALQSTLHSALGTLHISPLTQI